MIFVFDDYSLRTNNGFRFLVIINLDADNKNSQIVIDWINENNINILNVAGPKESNSSGIYSKTYDFITTLL
jgi:hypothetical protein